MAPEENPLTPIVEELMMRLSRMALRPPPPVVVVGSVETVVG